MMSHAMAPQGSSPKEASHLSLVSDSELNRQGQILSCCSGLNMLPRSDWDAQRRQIFEHTVTAVSSITSTKPNASLVVHSDLCRLTLHCHREPQVARPASYL